MHRPLSLLTNERKNETVTILPSPDLIVQIQEETAQAAVQYTRCLRQSLSCLDFSQPANKAKGHAIINLLEAIQNTHYLLERTDHDVQTVKTPAITNVLNTR